MRKRNYFLILFCLLFLSVSGGGNSDIVEQPILIEVSETSYSMEAEKEVPVIIAVEVSPAEITYYELQAQNNQIAEQIEKADKIDDELEGIIEQLKKEE